MVRKSKELTKKLGFPPQLYWKIHQSSMQLIFEGNLVLFLVMINNGRNYNHQRRGSVPAEENK